jgi:hypothetical protein
VPTVITGFGGAAVFVTLLVLPCSSAEACLHACCRVLELGTAMSDKVSLLHIDDIASCTIAMLCRALSSVHITNRSSISYCTDSWRTQR